MKSVLIIGMGKFGHHLCDNLLSLGNDVMVIDRDEEKVSDLVGKVTNVQIGDCATEAVVKSLGVNNFDIVFVCIGMNFQSSLEVTYLVKQMGAKYVISKANRDVHAKFLLRNGADEVIYPDRDIAENLAKRCSVNHVFEYIDMPGDYSIYEIPILAEWANHTIKALNIRQRYEIAIIGVKDADQDDMQVMPSPDYSFKKNDHIMVLGLEKDVNSLLKKIHS